MGFIVSELGFFELIDIGFFEAFWNWSNVYLTILMYLSVLLGAAVQYLLCRKCQRPFFRWSLIVLCLIGILISEYALIFITGWGSFSILLIYGFILCILLGAVLMKIIHWMKNRM